MPGKVYTDGAVSHDFQQEDLDKVMRFAAARLPSDSEMVVASDPQGVFLGLPVKAGKTDCWGSYGADRFVGKIRKTASGDLELDSVLHMSTWINLWKEIFLGSMEKMAKYQYRYTRWMNHSTDLPETQSDGGRDFHYHHRLP